MNRPGIRNSPLLFSCDYSIYEGTFGNPLLRRALSKNYYVRASCFLDWEKELRR